MHRWETDEFKPLPACRMSRFHREVSCALNSDQDSSLNQVVAEEKQHLAELSKNGFFHKQEA